jgi:hypothetical protein
MSCDRHLERQKPKPNEACRQSAKPFDAKIHHQKTSVPCSSSVVRTAGVSAAESLARANHRPAHNTEIFCVGRLPITALASGILHMSDATYVSAGLLSAIKKAS